MRFWLFKSEPSTWSWEDQVAKGDQGEEWDGVRNYQARNFMREMQIGDLGFFLSFPQRKISGWDRRGHLNRPPRQHHRGPTLGMCGY